ncbi:MAG TPA: cadherin repeat domain-containing protein, partial [Candidatus Dojkabacteria bacterium]
MKRLFLITIGLVFVLFSIPFNSQAQSNDKELWVAQPVPGDEVSGIADIVWYMDAEVGDKYEIKLFKNKCNSGQKIYSGQIVNNEIQTVEEGNLYSHQWEILDESLTVEKGDYCLMISYTSQNIRGSVIEVDITVTASNPDSLEIKPIEDFFITPTDQFSITPEILNITEGTGIVYSIVNPQSHFLIDKNSGEINLIEDLGLGTYEVIIKAEDTRGNSDKEAFAVNLVEENSEVDSASVLLDLDNYKNFFHKELKRSINWEIAETLKPNQIQIEISQDGVTWQRIFSSRLEINSFIPDLANLEDDEYILRYSVIKDNTTTILYRQIHLISGLYDQLSIVPIVIDHSPELTVDAPVESIFGKLFYGSQEEMFDIKVILNQEDITETCVGEGDEFECVLAEAIKSGANKVIVEILNGEAQLVNVKEWYFSFSDNSEPIIPSPIFNNESNKITIFGTEISVNTIVVSAVLIILGLILITIPWFIFTRIFRRKKSAFPNFKKEMRSQNSQNPNIN